MISRQYEQNKITGKEHFFTSAPCLFFSALLFVLIISVSPSFAKAQTVQTPLTSGKSAKAPQFSQLPEKARLHILMRMIRANALDDAEQLLNANPFTGKHAENRTLFLQGLIAKLRQNYDLAISKFRKALSNDPKLTLVRAELAHTLFLTENDDGAKHHLQLLSKAAPTTDQAKQFDNFLDAIDARRPFKASAYVAMAPSTNYTNGTTTRQVTLNGLPFTITGNGLKQSGIGIRAGANASYTLHPGKDLSVIAAAGINLTQYKGRDFDDTMISQSLSVVRTHKQGKISVGVSANQRWSGADEFIHEIGPELAITQRLDKSTSLQIRTRHLQSRFKTSKFRNGYTTTSDIRLSQGFGADSAVYLLSGAQRTITKRKHLDFWMGYVGAALYRETSIFGLNLYAEGKIYRKLHDGDYPLLSAPQKDTKISLLASFTKRDWDFMGVAPRLDITYVRNMSNSPFSDYSSWGANITMTKGF